MTAEMDAAPVCPRCGGPLVRDSASGVWFCPRGECAGVPPLAPEMVTATASLRGAVGAGPAPTGPAGQFVPETGAEEEVRPSRRRRVLLAVVALAMAAALLSLEISPALWSGRAALTVSPHQIEFVEGDGGALLPLAFAIQNGGRGKLEWQAESDAPWLRLSPSSGTVDSELAIVTASVSAGALGPGSYVATCTITAPGAHNSPQVVTATLTLHSTAESRAIADSLGESVEVREGVQPPYVADPIGSPIVLVNNDAARDVTLAELVEFLRDDETDEDPYVQDLRMCGAFAEQLHNNAEAAGIRAAWVSLDLQGQEIGHALNAFVTTDRGLVFVDSTGDNPLAIVSPDGRRGECECDRIGYVRVGSEFGLISIDQAVDPSYDFYAAYSAAWEAYLQDVAAFNALAVEYNALVDGRTLDSGSAEARGALRMHARLESMRRDLEMRREVLGPCRWTTLGIVEFVRLYW